MLTNNTKSRFVKGIALLLAALMVFAVCLTGCSDKEAREAAANAQTTADAATTEAEVAAQITEALKDYLKTADAEATVKKIVEEALAAGDDLAAKLEGYVTKDQLNNALATVDINKAIDEAIKSGKLLDAAAVQKIIDDALKANDVKIEERLGKTTAEIKTALDKMNKTMNVDEWNEATNAIMETLAYAENLLNRVSTEQFTQEARKQINELCQMDLFVEEKGEYKNYDAAKADDTMAALGLAILRAPNMGAIEEVRAGFAAAGAVKCLREELTETALKLYGIGQLVDVDVNSDGKFDEKDKADDKTTYHNQDTSKAQKVAQVVTIDNKAAFDAVNAEIEALVIKYVMDPLALTGKDIGFKASDIRDVYKKGNDSKDVAVGSLKGSPYSTSNSTDAGDGWTYSYTMVPVIRDYKSEAEATQNVGKTTTMKDFGAIRTDLAVTSSWAQVVALLDWVTPTTTGKTEPTKMSATYAAIKVMLFDCQAAIDKANAIFKTYLDKILAEANIKPAANQTQDQLRNATTIATYESKQVAYMCEPTQVPANSWTTPWLTDVTVDVDAAMKINGGSTTGLYRYDLYTALLSKAYDLLFTKYQTIALDTLNQMLNDYLVAVEAAGKGQAAIAADAEAVAEAAATTLNLTVSEDFMTAFYAGEKFAWGEQNLKVEATMPGMDQYYANEYVAFVQSDKTNSAAEVDHDVFAAIAKAARTLKIELAAATTGARQAIYGAKVSDKKGTIAVQKAFNAELEQAKANLDEIINRQIYDQVKNALINDIYAAITTNTEGKFTNGIAVYFNEGTLNADIAKLLEQYVTGYSLTIGETAFVYTYDKDGVLTAVDKKGTAVVVDDFATLSFTAPEIKIGELKVADVATQAIKAANDKKAAAINMLANMAVKARFEDYLRVAKETLYFTYYSYANTVEKYDMLIKLQTTYNEHLEQITITEYYHNMGVYKTEEYLGVYTGMLNDVIAVDSTYMNLTAQETLDKNLKQIKSYNVDPAKYVAVEKPVKINGLDAIQVDDAYATATEGYYYGVGAAAVDFDKVVNPKVTDKEGKNPLY